jgi:hypothetical protein
MKMSLLITVVLVAAVVAVILFLRSHIAESGTQAEVPSRLAKLKQNTDPKAFLGFCTRDEDALYFVCESGVFNLDYELTTPQKESHAAAFRKTASDLGFIVVDTTYYGRFPVLRVKIDASETHVAEVGAKFAQQMFGHDEKTVVEFLP